MNHQDYMRLALEEARIAFEYGEVPIGAVVVHDNQVIAKAHNEKELRQDPTAHAEVLAVQRATQALGVWRLSEATLYVTLEPCPMCAGSLVQARLKTLVFGAADLKGGAVGSVTNVLDVNRWNHRVEVVAGILEEECSQILKDFFRKLR
ncbi:MULTISPECIES: tRNA adenosine(34) deaminase TadA [Desulfitobacterium]|uniref:tRNA-specific adenosine deaminase n=1 Tax=Desulfitobacterium dehalogenans (strain ATCC 51507 / DSM 9161 / JW/IU-DC1) TaxID=756499 RepID=I4A3H6_DESDJ|nr:MULTISPECIES: tRNA adenosine(34) deaminase TadA [Desulfitobacterium]AFL98510.1 cytosine/adenosine deaminase [Desulfitobacterium dehalogenans ATCC 51507]